MGAVDSAYITGIGTISDVGAAKDLDAVKPRMLIPLDVDRLLTSTDIGLFGAHAA